LCTRVAHLGTTENCLGRRGVQILSKKFDLSPLPLFLDLLDTVLSFIAIVIYVLDSYGLFDSVEAVVLIIEVRSH
jgi:hypothetical protein